MSTAVAASIEEVRGNPFVRYRHRLDSYGRWIEAGGTEDAFIELIEVLDASVAAVDGHGFVVTPLSSHSKLALAAGLGPDAQLWVKDETGNVSGSHKARHLFGLALHAAVDVEFGTASVGELVIASCGNAALAAAVVAKASNRDLRVFIPTWADEAVVAALADLGTVIERCERREGEVGDPCYLRFREAVDAGASAFAVQGSDAPATFDGGRTIGWELAEQLGAADDGPGAVDRVFVQVGGGALGTCVAAGLRDGVAEGWLTAMPRIHGVQTEAVAPLQRAWDLLTAKPDPLARLKTGCNLDEFMWPWGHIGESAATGILDDVTYDWVPLTEAMLSTGGSPIVVMESEVRRALRLGRDHTGIDVDATGTAGLAGLLSIVDSVAADERVVVLFTGRRR